MEQSIRKMQNGAPQETLQRISRRQFLYRNLVLAGTVAMGECVIAEGTPQVTRHTLEMRGLKKPMRLVQLSDFHRSWCVSEAFLMRVVEQANELKPDVALLTGDFVTKSAGYMESCLNALSKLDVKHGAYAVLGNHDYASDGHTAGPRVVQKLHSINIPVLTNAHIKLDTGLTIVGVDDYWLGHANPALAFQGVNMKGAVIGMTHNPGIFPWLSDRNCPFLAGHTHGGQIHFPLITPYLLQSIGRKAGKFLSGWYREEGQPGSLYVSRGIGVVGIPMRFRCDPEITLFDLEPA